MRKHLAALAGAAVLVPSIAIMAASPASAQCPGADGSVPGTGARVVQVGTHPNVIYIDDRDYPDADDDNDAGGLWIYAESGKKPNLQRGGDQIAFATAQKNGVNPNVPRIEKIVVPNPAGVPGPTLITLFPNGFGGGSISETAGSHDDCNQDIAANRDNILF